MTAPQPHYRRVKTISFMMNSVEYSTQISDWKVSAGIKTGNRIYTQSVAGEGHNSLIEETDGVPVLTLTFLADWTAGGISDYLWQHNMTVVTYTLDHHPDIVGEHIQFSGTVQLQAPDTGAIARTSESQTVNLPIIGAIPTYARIG
jgi:hypothetical protein